VFKIIKQKIKEIHDEKKFSLIFLLGTVFTIQNPQSSAYFHETAFYYLMLVSFVSFCFVYSFFENYTVLFVFLLLGMALIYALISKSYFSFVYILFWTVWAQMRGSRMRNLVLVFVFMAQPLAFSQSFKNKLSQLSSCIKVNGVKWHLKANGKKVRRLFKDNLKLNNEKKFSEWEYFQVVNVSGEVTHVFRRQFDEEADSIRYDSYVLKSFSFKRYVDTRKGRKILENHDLRNFQLQSVMTFQSESGDALDYLVNRNGRGTVRIKPASLATGRTIAPIIMEDWGCSRPEDDFFKEGVQTKPASFSGGKKKGR